MREIKFRAWSKIAPKAEYSMNYWKLGTGLDRSVFFDAAVNGEYGPGAIMQYTGLKDKNGKEIYEGDIVRSETYEISRAEVKWSYSNWHPFQYYMTLIEEDFEVIGNIYENPELL